MPSTYEMCEIEECDKAKYCRSYCTMHYQRLRAHGNPTETLFHHGTGSKENTAWNNMRQRCLNPNKPEYKNYGGRGITVADEWNDYETFLKDVGVAPSTVHTLDRIDNDGNYEPGNVRWAVRNLQAFNKRSTNKLHRGVSKVKNRYYAKITNNYHQIHIGTYLTLEDAALAYDIKAQELYGCL